MTAAKRSSRSSRSSKIRSEPPGMAKTREPRNCALPASTTVRSGPVSQISPRNLSPGCPVMKEAMFDVDLSIHDFDGRAVVALRVELNLASASIRAWRR
jgi:hypothetical protein